MSRNILTSDGWTFVAPAAVGGGAEERGIEHLMLVSDIAIDNRGRVRKNKHGARSPEPVEGQSPLYGLPGVEELFNYLCTDVQPEEAGKHAFEKLDEKNIFKVALSVLQARETATPAVLLDRLMLQHAASYRFGGIVYGVGFYVTTTMEFGAEGWALIRHYEDPYWKESKEPILAPCVLAYNETGGEQFWLPLDAIGVPGLMVINIEEEREAVQLALDLCDGRNKPAEMDPQEESDEG